MKGLVSIITPSFNNASTLEACIESVQQQTYDNWEHIIIDDASTDHSLSLARSLSLKDSRIKVLWDNTNKGAAAARNYGTSIARGEFIAFLDADDQWYQTKLEIQMEALLLSDVCFSSYDLMNSEGVFLKKKVKAIEELSYNKLLRANYIGNLTGIYNAKKLGKIYTKNLRKRQDWLLWLEALRRSEKPAIGIAQSLAVYRVNKSSLSSDKLGLLKHNYAVYRKGLDFSVWYSLFRMFVFLLEHFFVKRKLIIATNGS
jgi:glycosyltransferase involved in cell wall biosynthesis